MGGVSAVCCCCALFGMLEISFVSRSILFIFCFLSSRSTLLLGYVPAGTIWLHQTNLEGSVPEEMCILPAVMTDFRTDCHKDRQVQCTCCTSCYGI